MQKMGTAMSPMAPAYSSLFMGKFEQKFLAILIKCMVGVFGCHFFMVWNHSLESFQCFVDPLNSFHPSSIVPGRS